MAASELSSEIRTFAQMITGLAEEAEANGTQRKNSNFRTDLQFLLLRKKEWRKVLKGILSH